LASARLVAAGRRLWASEYCRYRRRCRLEWPNLHVGYRSEDRLRCGLEDDEGDLLERHPLALPYLNGFSENVREVLKKLDFPNTLSGKRTLDADESLRRVAALARWKQQGHK